MEADIFVNMLCYVVITIHKWRNDRGNKNTIPRTGTIAAAACRIPLNFL